MRHKHVACSGLSGIVEMAAERRQNLGRCTVMHDCTTCQHFVAQERCLMIGILASLSFFEQGLGSLQQ